MSGIRLMEGAMLGGVAMNADRVEKFIQPLEEPSSASKEVENISE